MNIRESLEALEESYMSPYASLSSRTRGRDKPEQLCDMRPEYQRDRDRILHSKAFRRLKHKTQVFLAPEGDHYRTRLTHTLEVSQIARTIAKTLRLNESLTEAIALGHDLGHTPFGHSGEYILNKICEDGFTHCSISPPLQISTSASCMAIISAGVGSKEWLSIPAGTTSLSFTLSPAI